MKIALLQTDTVWEDRNANFDRLRPKIAAAAAAGADLVLLPEMFACGFTMQVETLSEAPQGPSSRFLREMSDTHGLWIGGSYPRRVEGEARPFNWFELAGPEGQGTGYAKIHPFTFAKEHEHYAAGTKYVHVTIAGVRCTLFVCYDLRFADEFWATASETDAYLVVANWPEKRREHWRTLLRARAIENQAYVAGVNRVGEGSGLQYTGDSAVLDPWGVALCEASGDETMLLAEIDPARVHSAREKFPVLSDRRSAR